MDEPGPRFWPLLGGLLRSLREPPPPEPLVFAGPLIGATYMACCPNGVNDPGGNMITDLPGQEALSLGNEVG